MRGRSAEPSRALGDKRRNLDEDAAVKRKATIDERAIKLGEKSQLP
jgi:hypothetical protein